MRFAIGFRRLVAHLAILASALALVACIGQSTQQTESTPGAVVTSSATAALTPAASTTVTAAAGAAKPSALTPTPGSASVNVSPSEVSVGGVTLTMSVEPARHMFDMAGVTGTDPAQQQPQQQSSDSSKSESQGSAVFGGGMLRVTNNIDPSQSPPADSAQAVIRHVVVQVKTKDRGQPVPYLSLSMDVLLDGRPVIFDQGLAPMVAVDKDSSQVYYGNNVKFPQRGTYQVFIRMQSNPLLGKDQPQAAQFNLTLR